MSRRRRSGDLSHLRDTFDESSDCRPDLSGNGKGGRANKLSLDRHENEETSGTWSYKSTILAGQAVDGDSQGSTENSYQTARSGSVAGCSRENSSELFRFNVPSSMNKAIIVDLVPQSDLELSLSTDEPRSSSELNRNIESSDKSSQDSRDTNFNIKNDERVVPTPMAPWERCRGMDSPRYGRMASTPTKEESGSKILKRFSQEFMASSHRFTEKMLTIIDESESGYEKVDDSAVDLSRMTREFRKMCKFIQDESMPEHMNSTIGITKHLEEMEKANFQAPETIEESPIEISSSDDSPKSPEACVHSPRNCQKTPINRFKNAVGENQEAASPGSPNSTRYFVSLEKYLSEESPRTGESARGECHSSAGSAASVKLRDKEKIVEKCEQQLAALDESNDSDFHTFDSHCARATPEPEFCDESSVEMVDAEDLAAVDNDAIDEDGLSMSLRLELEKQRERCFETARRMQKIEQDAKASNEDYSKVLERLGIDPETECRKTIQSLMTYQSCRAKLRRNEHTKKNETSSMDSGIDTRSISRTFQSSSKKSHKSESSSRVIASNSRRWEILGKASGTERTLSSRSKLLNSGSTVTTRKNEPRKTTAPKNSLKKGQKSGINVRSRSPSNLGSSTKARPRSRSRENKLPTTRISSNVETCRTPRATQAHAKTTNVLATIRGHEEKSEMRSTLQPFNKQRSDSGKKTSTPLASVESPILRFHKAPPRSSPIMKQRSVEKIANSPCTASLSPMIVTHSPRNRFFVTPGKPAPVMAHRRLGPLFKSPIDSQQSGVHRIIKSPHAPGIFRNGFNGNVISPVRTYIHGTDMDLIQNVKTKTNAMLLTPANGIASEDKITFSHDAKKTSLHDSPRRHRVFTPQKDAESQSELNDENKQTPDFLLAKANYELPTRVHTINQSPKSIGGARTRGLLQSTQNPLVIRHERKNYRKYEDHDVPESGSDSADMSIHVQKSAEKTNYANRWA